MAKEFLSVEENKKEIEAIKYNVSSVESLKDLDTIVVHNGTFHADDVAFVALILEARYELGITTIPKIIRMARNDLLKINNELVESEAKAIWGDVAGGVFDHHDMLVVRHPSNVHDGDFISEKRAEMPYAAASKLWLAIGEELVGSERFAKEVDEKFFIPLDLHDNFGSIEIIQDYHRDGIVYATNIPNSFSMAISWMNEDPKDPLVQMDAFMKAVTFVREIIRGMIKTYKNAYKLYTENKVEELEESNKDTGIVILDKYIPSYLFDFKKIKFIVEPANNPGWWQVVAINSNEMAIVKREIISTMSPGIGARLDTYDKRVDSGEVKTQKIFFHKTGYLACFPDKEIAIDIAKLSILKKAIN